MMINFTSGSKNSSNNTFDYGAFTEMFYFRLIYGMTLALIFICSVAGGLFVAFVIKTHKLMRKRVWYYLFILALSDAATSLFAIPIMIAAAFNRRVLLISWVCKINMFTIIFFGSWSVFTMATLSYHKFQVISRPFDTFGRNQNLSVKIYFVMTLILSLFFAGAPLLGFSGYSYIDGLTWCSISSTNPSNDMTYSILLAIFVFFIPLCIIITSSVRTYVVVKNQSLLRMKMKRTSQPEIQADQIAVFKTLFLIVIVFIILWTPMFIHTLLRMGGVSLPYIFSYIVYILIFMQGTINPAIYYFRQSAFRHELKKMLRKYDLHPNNPNVPDEPDQRELSLDTQSSVYSIRSPLYLVFPTYKVVHRPVSFNSTSYRAVMNGPASNANTKTMLKGFVSCSNCRDTAL